MLAVNNDKCTAIASGPAASKMGGSMTTQTVDCADCDWRVNKVPAKDWPEGSVRPVCKLPVNIRARCVKTGAKPGALRISMMLLSAKPGQHRKISGLLDIYHK